MTTPNVDYGDAGFSGTSIDGLGAHFASVLFMKPISQVLQFVTAFFLMLISSKALALLNGRPLRSDEKQQMSAIVPVIVRGVQGTARGVGVHIGDGLILTAWHVVHAIPNAKIHFFNLNNELIGRVRAEDYSVSAPPALEHIITANMKIPYPDLAIIATTGDIRERFRSLPHMTIETSLSNVEKNLSRIQIVGWGINNLDSKASREILGGRLTLSSMNEKLFQSVWNGSEEIVVPKMGDSGAPLFFKDESGIFRVFAITSLAAQKLNGSSVQHLNYFVRLGNEHTQKWLLSAGLSSPIAVAPGSPNKGGACKALFL